MKYRRTDKNEAYNLSFNLPEYYNNNLLPNNVLQSNEPELQNLNYRYCISRQNWVFIDSTQSYPEGADPTMLFFLKYEERTDLSFGKGYWLKFSSAEEVIIEGEDRDSWELRPKTRK